MRVPAAAFSSTEPSGSGIQAPIFKGARVRIRSMYEAAAEGCPSSLGGQHGHEHRCGMGAGLVLGLGLGLG